MVTEEPCDQTYPPRVAHHQPLARADPNRGAGLTRDPGGAPGRGGRSHAPTGAASGRYHRMRHRGLHRRLDRRPRAGAPGAPAWQWTAPPARRGGRSYRCAPRRPGMFAAGDLLHGAETADLAAPAVVTRAPPSPRTWRTAAPGRTRACRSSASRRSGGSLPTSSRRVRARRHEDASRFARRASCSAPAWRSRRPAARSGRAVSGACSQAAPPRCRMRGPPRSIRLGGPVSVRVTAGG